MSRHGIPIGRIFGISIDLDYSWFLIVGLLTWMLAASYFPAQFPDWPAGEYWTMGLVSAVLLFASVLLHELAHSLVAEHYGLAVPRITLFLFGGVSQLAEEPPGPVAEFWITVVGPVTSLALAALCWELEPLVSASQPLYALTAYLAWLNLILALFNLIPGFPLDGGRIFRAIVWKVTGNYHRATVTAGVSGRFFGFLLIFIGAWMALTGDIAGGIWIAFIGWYLESAAGSQLQQEALKNLLGGHRVADAMRRDFPRVSGDVTLEELVDRYMLPSGARYVIVMESGEPRGMATLAAIRGVPRPEWPNTMAAGIMMPFQKLATTEPNAVLWSAFEKMGRDGVNQLPVMDGNKVIGMLSREDIVHYLGVLRTLAA
jgi:Zn-dependent protease/CBS domain-containing protein